MKEQTLYICEYCNERYGDKASALTCELSHPIPIGIAELYFKHRSKYPKGLKIQFADGHSEIYFAVVSSKNLQDIINTVIKV